MNFTVSLNKTIINKNDHKTSMGYLTESKQYSTTQFIEYIKKGYAWTPGVFKNRKRKKCNFISSEIIGIDIDHGLTVQEIFKNKFIIENALLLYTSVNHTEKNHRFRILFRLPCIITDVKQYELIANALIINFNADKTCKDASRLFYGNTKAKIKTFNKILSIDELKNLKIIKKPQETETIKEKKEKDKIPKNIEYQLKNIAQLESMLFSIQEKYPVLPYKEWLTICSAIWSEFSFPESTKVLKKYYPEKKENEYEYKYKHKLDTIPFTTLIKLAVSCGYIIPDYQDFVRIDKEGKICSSPVAIEDFLYEQGFFSYFHNSENLAYKFIQDQDNILKEVGIKRICEYLKEYIMKNYKKNDAEDIRNYLNSKNSININKLNYLSSPVIEFHKDTKELCYFYFTNGYLEISKDNMKFYNSYKLLDSKKVWGSSIKTNDFQMNKDTSDFEKFLRKVSNQEQDRINAMYGVIGYLLHRFKNPNINKCVVFNDEQINVDNPTGRTGKSLICNALSYVRSLVQIDGKSYDPNDRFRFQNIEPTTELIHVDDVTAQFNLKNFYSILTGELKTEKKGETSFILPFKESPKFMFSSNYTVNTGGGSDRARVAEISLHNCFNEYYQPKHEYGKNFFWDWSQDEWNSFFTFCAKCVQHYLSEGLSSMQNSQLLKNKIIKQTDSTFEKWVSTYDFFQKDKKFFSKSELFGEYVCFCQTDFDPNIGSKNLFTRWIKTYFNIMEIHFKEKSIRTPYKIIWGYEIKI